MRDSSKEYLVSATSKGHVLQLLYETWASAVSSSHSPVLTYLAKTENSYLVELNLLRLVLCMLISVHFLQSPIMGADERTKICNRGPEVNSVLKLDNSICWQNQKINSKMSAEYIFVWFVFFG